MALKDTWADLENALQGLPNSGDDVSADEINEIAHAVIQTETSIENIEDTLQNEYALRATTLSGYGITDAFTKEETGQNIVSVVNGYAEYAEGLFAHKASNLIGYGITDAYTKDEVNSLVGDIENALDGIITLENSYIGGEGA